MDKTDRNAQDSGPQDVGERNLGNSVGPENLDSLHGNYAERVMTTAPSNLLSLGSQAYGIWNQSLTIQMDVAFLGSFGHVRDCSSSF
jgi:hypothetical protein